MPKFVSRAFVKVTPTLARARSTFLLEVALDQDRVRQALARALRQYTGRDEPRARITQDEMAKRLAARRYPDGAGSLTTRTYQRWEAAETVPDWTWLEAISAEIEIPISELIASGEESDEPAVSSTPYETRLRQIVHEELEALRADLARLEAFVRQRAEEDPPANEESAGSLEAGPAAPRRTQLR
jgi:hypothetical protein